MGKYTNPCGTDTQMVKIKDIFTLKKVFPELPVLSHLLHPGGCTDDPECSTGNDY